MTIFIGGFVIHDQLQFGQNWFFESIQIVRQLMISSCWNERNTEQIIQKFKFSMNISSMIILFIVCRNNLDKYKLVSKENILRDIYSSRNANESIRYKHIIYIDRYRLSSEKWSDTWDLWRLKSEDFEITWKRLLLTAICIVHFPAIYLPTYHLLFTITALGFRNGNWLKFISCQTLLCATFHRWPSPANAAHAKCKTAKETKTTTRKIPICTSSIGSHCHRCWILSRFCLVICCALTIRQPIAYGYSADRANIARMTLHCILFYTFSVVLSVFSLAARWLMQ